MEIILICKISATSAEGAFPVYESGYYGTMDLACLNKSKQGKISGLVCFYLGIHWNKKIVYKKTLRNKMLSDSRFYL